MVMERLEALYETFQFTPLREGRLQQDLSLSNGVLKISIHAPA